MPLGATVASHFFSAEEFEPPDDKNLLHKYFYPYEL